MPQPNQLFPAAQRLQHCLASRRDTGFALVVVIWGLGLVALLGLAFITGARYRARFSANYTSAASTRLAAESAVNLAIADVLAGSDALNSATPLICRLPGGEIAHVSIEEENGKVDLNAAGPALLVRFFTALAHDASRGSEIAARVIEYRSKADSRSPAGGAAAGLPASAPRFTTIMQLDQIEGMTPPLLKTALRLVTVRSDHSEPDLAAAPPALLQMLGAELKDSNPRRAVPAGATVTIRADATGPDGSRFIREALVSLTAVDGRPFVIKEWRHGDVGAMTSPSSPAREVRNCIEFPRTAG